MNLSIWDLDAIGSKKASPRLSRKDIRKPRSFNVCTKNFLQVCGGECNLLCSHLLGNNIRDRDSKKLNKLIKAYSVLVTALEPLDFIVKSTVMNMKNNSIHPPHNIVLTQQCGQCETYSASL